MKILGLETLFVFKSWLLSNVLPKSGAPFGLSVKEQKEKGVRGLARLYGKDFFLLDLGSKQRQGKKKVDLLGDVSVSNCNATVLFHRAYLGLERVRPVRGLTLLSTSG